MLIASDTGPINYLVLIGHIALLEHLFGEVVIPDAVLRELTDPATPEPVRAWVQNRPAWVTVRKVRVGRKHSDLDAGEREALALAVELGVPLLCDEKAGRKAAAVAGVTVTGTLGVLQGAHLRGLLDIEEALTALAATTFRRSDRLFESVREETLRLEREMRRTEAE